MNDKTIRNDEIYTKYDAVSSGYKRNIRVKDVASAKKLMQRVFMQLQDGKIKPSTAKVTISSLRDFIGAVKDTKLENEIKELKELINKGK